MLNSDICLAKDIGKPLEDGSVACGGEIECPLSSVIEYTQEFKDDNNGWLKAFAESWSIVQRNGYLEENLQKVEEIIGPSELPTPSPSASPSVVPTPEPTRKTKEPTIPCGVATTMEVTWDDILRLEKELEEFVDEQTEIFAPVKEDGRVWIPRFVRNVFHDCVGGCDGCVNLDIIDNKGLEGSWNVLDDLQRNGGMSFHIAHPSFY